MAVVKRPIERYVVNPNVELRISDPCERLVHKISITVMSFTHINSTHSAKRKPLKLRQLKMSLIGEVRQLAKVVQKSCCEAFEKLRIQGD
jgi:hypothetical protein